MRTRLRITEERKRVPKGTMVDPKSPNLAGFLVSGFGFRVSGFGFRGSGFGFRVSGFGLKVWGLGSRAQSVKDYYVETLNPKPW